MSSIATDENVWKMIFKRPIEASGGRQKHLREKTSRGKALIW